MPADNYGVYIQIAIAIERDLVRSSNWEVRSMDRDDGGVPEFKPIKDGDASFRLVDLELVSALAGIPAFQADEGSLPALRDFPAEPLVPLFPPPAPQPVEYVIPGVSGTHDLRVVIIDATHGQRSRPAVLHMHGGGFITGYPMQEGSLVQSFAQVIEGVLVSVDYRLAPETPFPGALEDNYRALRWLFGNADSLGVDRSRIGLVGESAGGGHAAMLALATRDRGEFPIAFQLLIYPMLDDRTGSSRPTPAHIGQLVWTAGANRFAWSALLGQAAGLAEVPAGSVPARVKDLSGLPPTFIGVGAIDLFVQENIDFAQRLIEAGVPTELNVVPGAYHAFDVFAPNAGISTTFRKVCLDALRRGLL
jgi:acetyl esterase/lipase